MMWLIASSKALSYDCIFAEMAQVEEAVSGFCIVFVLYIKNCRFLRAIHCIVARRILEKYGI